MTQVQHVVLVHPEIHWNTGNAGRTCLATGATLHLIEPLGFSLDEREVKRAGLDYWEHVDRHVWPSWEAFDAGKLNVGRLVAVDGNRLLGWAALSPVSTRPVYRGVVEHSVYIAAAARGQDR